MIAQTPLHLHGIDVPIGSNDVSPVIWQALTDGSYEAKEARQVPDCIEAGDRILELGTGIGVITTLMARMPDVRIWSFDADPVTIALARRVADANGVNNVTFAQGLLSPGAPATHTFYIRDDFWMSSLSKVQGPYRATMEMQSMDIDGFLMRNAINVLVMDVEGAERDILGRSGLPGVDRIVLELHDHLYGLTGVRDLFDAMHRKGYAYDPRGSSGPCVLFRKDDGGIRPYQG